jgi:hypothetical protein
VDTRGHPCIRGWSLNKHVVLVERLFRREYTSTGMYTSARVTSPDGNLSLDRILPPQRLCSLAFEGKEHITTTLFFSERTAARGSGDPKPSSWLCIILKG